MSVNARVAGLPNHWNLFNLRESPYFQETLGESAARYPLSLFVGRRPELEQLLAGIGGSGSSRQAVGGGPGIGKTTLVQLAKAHAVENGYWATENLIPFYPDDTAERVMGRLLEGIYDAIVTARPHSAENDAMQQAQQHVRAFRLSGVGGTLSAFGFGGGVSQSAAAVTPAGSLMFDAPRLIHQLLELALTAGSHGLVLHLDNLENLTERDLGLTADILRSLRDPVLLQRGLHTILVGTAEAVTAATTSHAQLRTVFSNLSLEPLPISDVQDLLTARYTYLAVHATEPVIPPATHAAVAGLYALFRGDLRGLLKALEDGVSMLIGLVGTQPNQSLELKDLRPALKKRYTDQLEHALSDARFEQLGTWARHLGPESTPNQEELAKAWSVSQPAVSYALKDLIRDGCVLQLARRGADPATYTFSGLSRLALA